MKKEKGPGSSSRQRPREREKGRTEEDPSLAAPKAEEKITRKKARPQRKEAQQAGILD